MKTRLFRIALTAASLLMAANVAFATEVKVAVPDVKGAAKATGDSAKTGAKGAVADTKASAAATKDAAKGAAADTKAGAKSAADDAKAAAKAKVVDINTATEAELKSIPGIGDAYAAKIIAGRPYANKSQLKSRNILPAPVYEKTKDLIVAKQAVKEAVKPAATKK
jgi:competence protein ComEA